ncbi:Uncharacterized protein DAT39_005591 [Clarias magur]|uniref:Uncharacterized protein n=1 Tax=Clarias magur TaxID=1594786 RepID=A0A8J4ULU9_CLAMG|nr:Uncharacterized protein DAT39_005591 [Clarias magur]
MLQISLGEASLLLPAKPLLKGKPAISCMPANSIIKKVTADTVCFRQRMVE